MEVWQENVPGKEQGDREDIAIILARLGIGEVGLVPSAAGRYQVNENLILSLSILLSNMLLSILIT